ncbi:hypothetical protein [Lunatibacter salilacus]|nr:hypothetical protein [Lunatibacter salilacus]
MNKGFVYAVRHPMRVADGNAAAIPSRTGRNTTMVILVSTHIQSLTGPD